jgi:uncharacterized protein (TIGR00255 family)
VAETPEGVSSMTGFARQDGGDGALTWVWEAKSVNGKNLDLRCRVPSGYEALEVAARAAAQARCTRGNLQLTLNVDRGQAAVKLQVNRELLDQLLGLMRELESEVRAEPPRLDGLLAVRGVLETVEEQETEEQMAARAAAMEADLVLALEALIAMRRAEGLRLDAMAAGNWAI